MEIGSCSQLIDSHSYSEENEENRDLNQHFELEKVVFVENCFNCMNLLFLPLMETYRIAFR